jgi:ureidoglycolate lyase
MKTVAVKELSAEGFLPYGTYANFINPTTEKLGASPIQFFRDMLQASFGLDALPSFSTLRVEKRERIIDVSEYHDRTYEAILPLDNDVLMHVAPAGGRDGRVPVEKIEVFRLPRGTMAVLRPGVWHHAPFTANDQPANILIVLPERLYANDCTAIDIPEGEKLLVN